MIVVNTIWENIYALAYLHIHNIQICQIVYKLVKILKPSKVTLTNFLQFGTFLPLSIIPKIKFGQKIGLLLEIKGSSSLATHSGPQRCLIHIKMWRKNNYTS